MHARIIIDVIYVLMGSLFTAIPSHSRAYPRSNGMSRTWSVQSAQGCRESEATDRSSEARMRRLATGYYRMFSGQVTTNAEQAHTYIGHLTLSNVTPGRRATVIGLEAHVNDDFNWRISKGDPHSQAFSSRRIVIRGAVYIAIV